MTSLSKILIAALLIAIGGIIMLSVSTNNVWEKSETMEQQYIEYSDKIKVKFDSIIEYAVQVNDSNYIDMRYGILEVASEIPVLRHKDSTYVDVPIVVVPADTTATDSTTVSQPSWMPSDVNSYSNQDQLAPSPHEASTATNWKRYNGATLSTTGRKVDGTRGLEIDNSNSTNANVELTYPLDSTKIYEFEIELWEGAGADGYISFYDGSGNLLSNENLQGNEYRQYDAPEFRNQSSFKIRIGFNVPSSGKEIYVDKAALYEYVLQN